MSMLIMLLIIKATAMQLLSLGCSALRTFAVSLEIATLLFSSPRQTCWACALGLVFCCDLWLWEALCNHDMSRVQRHYIYMMQYQEYVKFCLVTPSERTGQEARSNTLILLLDRIFLLKNSSNFCNIIPYHVYKYMYIETSFIKFKMTSFFYYF